MASVVSVVASAGVDFASVVSDAGSVEAYDASVVYGVRSVVLFHGSVEDGVGLARGVVVATVSGFVSSLGPSPDLSSALIMHALV